MSCSGGVRSYVSLYLRTCSCKLRLVIDLMSHVIGTCTYVHLHTYCYNIYCNSVTLSCEAETMKRDETIVEWNNRFRSRIRRTVPPLLHMIHRSEDELNKILCNHLEQFGYDCTEDSQTLGVFTSRFASV